MAQGLGAGHFGTQHLGRTIGLPTDLAAVQLVYEPRPLITMTIAAATARYSTEDLEVPTTGVGVAQVGQSQVGE